WSAFWMQSPIIGASLDPAQAGVELDIMESFHPGDVIEHCCHYNGYGIDHRDSRGGVGKKGLDLNEYHTFAMEWDENGYTFYIDGEEDGKITDFLTARPEFILISTEVRGYRREHHSFEPEALEAYKAGDTFNDRSDANMAITSCFLKIGLETRDNEQIEEIKRRLTAEGFNLVSERC
ncbi:MAG: family 16 glycosylhydrolase, partial [Phascolarctobacterium sp.]|nr:family 16 glycosylhydrolase [Phascolarctobacterium sp.]